mmetsp:Transcript_1096/g.3131  ORF Transcript_1096/g.3131 Transcript_1096/m.3131 type:complete len:503 (-) Transcript_1096:206-1714(-)
MEDAKQGDGSAPAYGHGSVAAPGSGACPRGHPAAKPPRAGAILKFCLLCFFVASRAFHPLLIDMSKSDGRLLYSKNTPVLLNKVVTVVLGNAVSYATDGMEGLRLCWEPNALFIFGLIGVLFALGDFLEMLSMSSLGGSVYQVLMQTKFLITALMLWGLAGSKQTTLQWHVLFSLFLAMSVFVIIDSGAQGGGGAEGGSVPLGAVAVVVLKVFVSCWAAVLADKQLKAYRSLPTCVKITNMSVAWTVASLLLCVEDREMMERGLFTGFFTGWTLITWLVMCSFVVKTVSTMYLLQILNSVQKNIGEALAVLVIYVSQALSPRFEDKFFELKAFLLAVLIVALVKTYLLPPATTSAPAIAMYQRAAAAKPRPAARRVTIVPLTTPHASSTLQGIGFSTVHYRVAECLPDGVFYGMLGDAHPVCGYVRPEDKKLCELVMLAHPPVPVDDAGRGRFQASSAPNQALTVLGHVRGPLPEMQLTAGQIMQDIAQARSQFMERCTGVP